LVFPVCRPQQQTMRFDGEFTYSLWYGRRGQSRRSSEKDEASSLSLLTPFPGPRPRRLEFDHRLQRNPEGVNPSSRLMFLARQTAVSLSSLVLLPREMNRTSSSSRLTAWS